MLDLIPLLISLAVVIAIVMVFAFALAAAARGAERGRTRNPLSALSEIRSPSGKPFFPNSQSVTDLANVLKGLHELTPVTPSPAPRQSASGPRRRPPRAAVTPRPAR